MTLTDDGFDMSVEIEKFCENSKAVVVGNDVLGLEVGDILYTFEDVQNAIQDALSNAATSL